MKKKFAPLKRGEVKNNKWRICKNMLPNKQNKSPYQKLWCGDKIKKIVFIAVIIIIIIAFVAPLAIGY
jgi:hypothetical protein